jgi:hypothetical protein
MTSWLGFSRLANWPTLIQQKQDNVFMQELMRHTMSGHPFGSRRFIKMIEKELGYPVELKPRGRPVVEKGR